VVETVSGCSRNNSTATLSGTSRQQIYTLTDDDAMQMAHGAIVRSFPGRDIETITGPVRGYSTYTRMMLDTFTKQVVVRPVTGILANGQAVDGYVFEVSGSGTAGVSGGIQNAAFFDTLKRDLDRTGLGVEVVSSRPRRVDPVLVQPAASGSDPIEQLRRLRELYQQGAITGPEYEQKKSDLLRRI
jgi:hypothetical protein